MRRTMFALALCFLHLGACRAESSDVDIVWGIWNIGPKSEATYIGEMSLGKFMKTGEFLYLEPNYRGKQEIEYEGGYYKIIKIEKEELTYKFTLELELRFKNTTGKYEDRRLIALVLMHFIDDDHAWFEVVQGPMTDKDFPTVDFPGPGRVYWRAEKMVDEGEKK